MQVVPKLFQRLLLATCRSMSRSPVVGCYKYLLAIAEGLGLVSSLFETVCYFNLDTQHHRTLAVPHAAS